MLKSAYGTLHNSGQPPHLRGLSAVSGDKKAALIIQGRKELWLPDHGGRAFALGDRLR